MPELRKDPVLDRWVIIASERGRRPPRFNTATEPEASPNNPFAAGQEDKTPPEVFAIRRPGTPPNTPGWDVRVVPNRFPVLRVEGGLDPAAAGPYDLLQGVGAHEIIIETPRHDVDLCDLPAEHVEKVVTAYIERLRDLRRDRRLRYQMIFRSRGRLAGATINHPHSQLIATPVVPAVPAAKLSAALDHYRRKERCLFADIIQYEQSVGERVILETQHFIALAPYASRLPFEIVVYPLRQCHDLTGITDLERADFATVLIELLRRLRGALGDPPYTFLLFTAPNPVPRPGRPDYWATLPMDFRWHLEIVPRLEPPHGFEMGTGFYINPVAPEEAAAFLRDWTP